MATIATTTRPRLYGLPDIRGMDVETLNALYPTNLEPMPEGLQQFRPLLFISELLIRFFDMAGRDYIIFSDSFIYYIDECGARVNVAPDLCIALDVKLDDHGDDRSYFLERVGKPPDFVMEIGSPSTASRDLDGKRRIYAHIGIAEYWLFDPEAGSIYGFPLMGLRLVDGEYAPIELGELPNGAVRGHSEALGLTLLYEDGELHVIDPSTGLRLRRPTELATDERAAQRRAEAAQRRAEAAQRRAEAAQRRAEAAETELAELRRRLGGQ